MTNEATRALTDSRATVEIEMVDGGWQPIETAPNLSTFYARAIPVRLETARQRLARRYRETQARLIASLSDGPRWLVANWPEVVMSLSTGAFLVALTIGVALWAGWHFPEARRESCFVVGERR